VVPGPEVAARGGDSISQTVAQADGHHPTTRSEPGDEAQSRRLTWSQLIRKAHEIDPLLRPFCGAAMRIVAFILDRSSLGRILQRLDCDGQQPEPLAHSPPTEAELSLAAA
jgi:hypothetical protein